MIKIHEIFILLSALYLVSCNEKTDVFYDSKYDIIFHNGKLYFPSKNNEIDKRPDKDSSKNEMNNPHKNNEEKLHEEELVSGAKFWVYIFIILCKYLY
jgi:hypothetical protein